MLPELKTKRGGWKQPPLFFVLDSNGNAVVKYYYDAWGNQIVEGSNTALGNLNPMPVGVEVTILI